VKVKVVTKKNKVEIFEDLDEAKESYPDLDPDTNGPNFTWGMEDSEYLRFEDWETQEFLSR
jgi:hypothetical protein